MNSIDPFLGICSRLVSAQTSPCCHEHESKYSFPVGSKIWPALKTFLGTGIISNTMVNSSGLVPNTLNTQNVSICAS